MVKEILYTTALNEIGELIHINNTEKGNRYFCPSCKSKLVLRKSGKTGKGSRRPHFAHALNPNCSPETVLHYSFKKMTVDLLNKYVSAKREFTVNWNCNECSKINSGNLLAKIASVKDELNLKVCKPDIALIDAENNVIAVIEIVVTHEPEERTLQYYRENKIVLIQINLNSDEDLARIENKIKTPFIVDYCFKYDCSNYVKHPITRTVHAERGSCGRCFNQIERYFIELNSAFGIKRTLDFKEDEIKLVESNRKNIQVKDNKLTKEKYPIFVCYGCIRMGARSGRRF